MSLRTFAIPEVLISCCCTEEKSRGRTFIDGKGQLGRKGGIDEMEVGNMNFHSPIDMPNDDHFTPIFFESAVSQCYACLRTDIIIISSIAIA